MCSRSKSAITLTMSQRFSSGLLTASPRLINGEDIVDLDTDLSYWISCCLLSFFVVSMIPSIVSLKKFRQELCDFNGFGSGSGLVRKVQVASHKMQDSQENHQIKPPAQGGVEGSLELLLTKNPARSFSCPLPGTQLNGSRGQCNSTLSRDSNSHTASTN